MCIRSNLFLMHFNECMANECYSNFAKLIFKSDLMTMGYDVFAVIWLPETWIYTFHLRHYHSCAFFFKSEEKYNQKRVNLTYGFQLVYTIYPSCILLNLLDILKYLNHNTKFESLGRLLQWRYVKYYYKTLELSFTASTCF